MLVAGPPTRQRGTETGGGPPAGGVPIMQQGLTCGAGSAHGEGLSHSISHLGSGLQCTGYNLSSDTICNTWVGQKQAAWRQLT